MATLEQLTKRVNALNPENQYVTIEQYVFAKASCGEGETTQQAIARFYPNTKDEFPPATLKILEERQAESAAIDKRRAEEAEERRRR